MIAAKQGQFVWLFFFFLGTCGLTFSAWPRRTIQISGNGRMRCGSSELGNGVFVWFSPKSDTWDSLSFSVGVEIVSDFRNRTEKIAINRTCSEKEIKLRIKSKWWRYSAKTKLQKESTKFEFNRNSFEINWIQIGAETSLSLSLSGLCKKRELQMSISQNRAFGEVCSEIARSRKLCLISSPRKQ